MSLELLGVQDVKLKREWQVTNNRCYDYEQHKISIFIVQQSMRLFDVQAVDGIDECGCMIATYLICTSV